ncbi:prion-inhibition and propagation domain-containing protein [Trichoderma breve]|uniref:Prion-inhibition and propagation domain-containing protein n=1 Tax=Trichoderma breve TaxID=2034170 RepID=A0A9W9BDJ8_9HYPO|nr:prion-inhibition and propagation domain-containing protein [Trichoderma breve]KAJ4859374.1 prion-inhibition and propagation domain-containing protein [Trichoderma breve]
MDVTGLAVGIVDLYTTCRDCYNFFTTSILKAWGFHWQIHSEGGREPEHSDPTRRKRTKLHEYLLSNRFKAEGVFNTLSALADTLSDQDKLTKRYGIRFQPAQAIQDGSQLMNNVQFAISGTTIEDAKPVISEIRSRLSLLNKFKWSLKDKDNFKKLIADLRSHSDSLYRLCPEIAFESMNIYLTMECLAREESPTSLKWTSSLATQLAEVDEQSSVREGYELLASAATLKASVNQNRDRMHADDSTLTSVEEEQREMRYLGKGLALFEGQVVYVEMRDYRGPPLELTPEQKQKLKRRRNRARFLASFPMDNTMNSHYGRVDMDQTHQQYDSDESESDEVIEAVRPADPKLRTLIRNFVNTFQGENNMKSVYGLDIAGMIDHTESEHKGHCSILYRLPGTTGVQSRDRPAENLKLRAPVTLESLLGTKQKQGIRSTLGARFELARKLVHAVCLLHSSGWLHKNIRADSVIFFPEHANALQEDRYEVKFEIDVSKPILMGYIFSRPDDIMISSATEQPSEKGRRAHSTTQRWYDPMDKTVELKRRSGTPRGGAIYGPETLRKGPAKEQTKETNISGFMLDYYQHPAKHADPKRLYRHAYDIYSLGILLLEVGLWEKLKNYEDTRAEYNRRDYYEEIIVTRRSVPDYDEDDHNKRRHINPDYDEEDHYERRRWICRVYLDRLRWACGDKYADVVLSCLMINSSDDEVAKASERELCARIIADLEGCQA